MRFTELQKIFKSSFGIEKLADIARELKVTPQVVNSWKAKNNVPYKSVKILRDKLDKLKKQNIAEKVYRNIENDIVSENTITEESISFLEIIIKAYSMMLKNIYLFFFPIFTTLIYAFYYLIFTAEPVYVSTAVVLPQATDNNKSSGLSGIAASFGIGSSGGGKGGSLASAVMVPEILSSRRLSVELLHRKFDVKGFSHNSTLASILNGAQIDLDSISQKKRYKLTSKVNKMIVIRPDKNSPVVNVSAMTNNAQLSKDLVDATIYICNEIIESFQFKELEQKKIYIKRRLHEISSELIKKEDALKSFREKNRTIISSPTLMLEQERLIRELEVQSELYVRLRSESELLNLEEVGASEILQILDVSEVPIKKISPKPFEYLFISGLIGVFLGASLSLGRSWFKENEHNIFLIKDNYFV